MKKEKILYIATTDNTGNRLDGETIKCKLINSYLNNLPNIELICIDTNKWKHHIVKLIFLIIYNYIKCDRIIISAANKGASIILKFCKVINNKKRLSYFVIGGSLYNDILKNNWDIDIYRNIYGIYVESNFLKKKLNSLGLKNVKVINNFKKINKFKNMYKKTKETKFVFYSRIIKEKGIEEAIHLIKRLNKENIKCLLDIYGQVDKKYLEFLQKKFTDNIRYCGLIKPDSKTEYEILSYYDIFILPTEYKGECLPGALIDAYISGLAVVVSNWEYAKEYVKDNKNGIIFNYKDYEDMYIKTKNMILSGNIELYKENSRILSKRYDIDIVLKKWRNYEKY